MADQAIVPFRSSVQKNPNNPQFHYHLGLAYAKVGDKQKAISSFDEAIKRKPDYTDAIEARKAVLSKE